MSWLMSLRTAGQLALSAIQLFARMLYVLSTPLRWPLYYIYTSIVFLLSPIWVMFSLGLSAVSFATNLMARLKYFYVYFACATIIGICAGFMLHGTSSIVFVLLGVDTVSERRKLSGQQQQGLHSPQLSPDSGGGKGYDSDSSTSAISRRYDVRQHIAKVHASDLVEKRGRLLRNREQPRSRQKGLLEQTIHEESSESDFL